MSITVEGMPPEAAAYMAGSGMTIWVKGDHSRSEMTLGMMGKNTTISNQKTKEVVTLMDMMGQKYMIKSTAADASKEKAPDVKITYLNETKTIAGYKCKKAQMTVTDKDGKSQPVDVWYTEELNNYVPEDGFKGFKGMPMEYQIAKNGMKMNISVTSISKEAVADNMFTIPEGYKETTKEEMQKGMKGGR